MRARLLRIAVIGTVLTGGLGVAIAAADDLPTSTPDVFTATVDADDLRDAGYDGSGVTVAVIDTGVADVPGMDGKVVHQQNISAAPQEGDQYGHGTFVAGLVHETAPGADIVSIKLSGANGAVDVTQVLAALQWVIANKDRYSIDVVNLSFGNDSKQSAYASPLNFAVQRVWDAGIVVVSSAGNLGDHDGTVTKPGDDPLIISVGASDDQGTARRYDDTIPAFSSRGPTQDGLSKPDLVAPGTRVISLRAPGSTVDVANPQARIGDDHFRGSGTSFAAPIMSGVVAIMLSVDPDLDPDQVKYGLLSTARSVDGWPTASGAGTARAYKAVIAAQGGRANTGTVRSTGLGSLHAARGSAIVKVRTNVRRTDGSLATLTVPVTGDHTAEVPAETSDAPVVDAEVVEAVEEPSAAAELQVDPVQAVAEVTEDATDHFDLSEFRDRALWEASQWGASQWGASQWGASQWGASQWGASQWGASQWGSSQWWASQWG
jgi:serine protease AprX